MLIHVSKPVHDMPRRYRVEFEPVRRARVVAVAAIALGVALVAVANIGAAAPPEPVVTLFSTVLRPADARVWMRASLGIVQPRFIGDAR